ncbi:MAG: efflux RND transporter periplasmic adaptor subunit [Candidatus Zixiibacteriota bacterium]
MKKILFISLFLSTILLNSCDNNTPNIDTESSIPVRVEPVTKKGIEEYIFATGTVNAVQSHKLYCLQSGLYDLQINPRTKKPYAMADEVKAGDIIIKIINPEFENQVSLESYKLQHENAQREYEKQKKIYEKGGITLNDLSSAERDFVNARYSYANARLQLEKLNVTALFDGIITDLPFYGKDQLIQTGTLMAEVMDYSRLYSEVALPGKEIDRVKKGQIVNVTNYSKADDTLFGTISQVSPALDPNSRTFKATIVIDNPGLILRSGMFVKADIVVESRDSAIVIPKDAVLDRRGSKIVYVVEKGIAVERRLETGLSNKTDIEILSGLTTEDRLVIEGFETLRNSSKVKVLE